MKQTDNTFESLSEHLTNLTEHGIQGMNEQQILARRKEILSLQKQVRSALASTSTKDRTYNGEHVMLYVQDVLKRGFNGEVTKLAHNQLFVDAQHLTWWKHIIKACVQQSAFSTKQFKIVPLAVQRADIEQSTTLHELRQAVKAMIGPLEMYREYNAPEPPIEYELTGEDQLIVEIEQLNLLLAEKDRMIDAMLQIYDEPYKELKEKIDVVQSIDDYKATHNCTDEQAGKVFDVSRSKLHRLRKDISEGVQ